MTDWQTVRFDPNHEETLDPEIIPLCDALNAAGIVTTSSCSGHGARRPCVWFEDTDTARIEQLARFILASEHAAGDHQASYSEFNRETLLDGHLWSLRIHLNTVWHDTSHEQALGDAVPALARVTALVNQWAELERAEPSND